MPIDSELEEALDEVVRKHNQPAALARRASAWLRAKSESALSAADEGRHLEIVLEAIQIKTMDS